jgi:hypothetical protein
MRRVTELACNIADIRWFFSGTYEVPWVFYLGAGAGVAFDFYYDQHGQTRYPPYDNVLTGINFAGNVLLGMEHVLPKSGWITTIGIKVKFWEPIVFQVSWGLTRPFKLKADKEAQGEDEAAGGEPAVEPEAFEEEPEMEPAPLEDTEL